MDKKTQLQDLESAYQSFVALVRALTPGQFLKPIGSWAARDIVAHLVGWNHNIRLGGEGILRGSAPFYHPDGPNDYRAFNAEFMRRYDSVEPETLLSQLDEGWRALAAFFEHVSEQDWARDFGPQHYRGGPATVARCAESITREYIEHAREISAGLWFNETYASPSPRSGNGAIIATDGGMTTTTFAINRAPVLTLWATVVAMRLGYDEDTSLTLGQALAALNAQSKGRRLGIYEASVEGAATDAKKSTAAASVRLLGREIPVVKARRGLRASPGGQTVEPESVKAYLEKKFGNHLGEARQAMELLAASLAPDQLAARGFSLYERFRPQIPEGKKGWGAKGELDLGLIRRLTR